MALLQNGNYDIEEDSNGDLVIRDPNGNTVLKWDDSVPGWTFNGNSIERLSSVSTERLVIGGTLYEEDGNSPINVSGTSSTTYTLSGNFSEIIVLLEAGEQLNGFDQLQVNGDTGSNYEDLSNADNTSTGNTAFNKPFDSRLSRFEIRDRGNQVAVRYEISRADSGLNIAGENSNLGNNGINQFTLSDAGGASRAMKARVFGRSMQL